MLPLETIQILIALLGAVSGIASLFIHYRNFSSQKPFLVAWVLSASYSLVEEKTDTYPDLVLEIGLLVQNKGKRNTTISNAFAEVKVGKQFPAIHCAEGKISVKDVDGEVLSGPVFLQADDSKIVNIGFIISSVDPQAVHRVFLAKTPLHSSILQDPIAVDFTLRHTHGSLFGTWYVYNKDQKFEQFLTRWFTSDKIREGKPHWFEGKKPHMKRLI